MYNMEEEGESLKHQVISVLLVCEEMWNEAVAWSGIQQNEKHRCRLELQVEQNLEDDGDVGLFHFTKGITQF